MSFIRPGAVAALHRWREALLGAVLFVLGVWLAATTLGLPYFLGLVMAPLGAVLIFTGLRRGRYQPGIGGPGVVDVDERQITYFGPEEGGVVSLDAMTRVTICTDDTGATHWIFEGEGAAPVLVPAFAEGADQLYDAITALPGVDFTRLLEALEATHPGTTVVWQATRRRLH